MSFILFWYILRDLLKILVMTTVVVVTVISFGASIKPLSDGTLSPMGLLTYILLAMPPMLEFALPFSAAFSATLVYHRMGTDNEIAACAAGGVPYTQILLPAAALGLILTIGLSVLSNSASPRLWEAMERIAHLDAPEYFERSVRTGEPISADGKLIYVRSARRLEPEPGSDAYASMLVEGLLITEIVDGRPIFEATSEVGLFNLFREGDMTIITGHLKNPTLYEERTNLRAQVDGARKLDFAIPDSMQTKTKFMDISRLREIAADPELYYRVSDRVDDLRNWVIERKLAMAIDRQLAAQGRLTIVQRLPNQDGTASFQEIHILGGGLDVTVRKDERWRVIGAGENEPVRVILKRSGRDLVEFRSYDVGLKPSIRLRDEPSVSIDILNGMQIDLDRAEPNPTPRDIVNLGSGMTSLNIAEPLRQRSGAELIVEASGLNPGDDPEFSRAIRRLDLEKRRLRGRIIAEFHERTALSLSCVIMMMLGAVLAIHMRQSLPLMVYLWSFLPAIASLLLTTAGADLVQNPDVADSWGLLILWSGNLAMMLMAFLVFHWIKRN